MAKYPSEIFGFYWQDVSQEANEMRQKYWCPFHNSVCYKQSRLLSNPFGVCTAHVDGKEIALCPRRFLEKDIVFRDIANRHFGTCNNVLVFSEIGLREIGNFDFVMVKHKPMSVEVEDFVIVEFQTGQTTGTGKLVNGFNDFMKNRQFPKGTSYNFSINTYDIWKRTFTQILNKGIILEKWKRKIFRVIQEPIFEYFQHKYRLHEMNYDEAHSTVFALYDLQRKHDKLVLAGSRILSSTIDELFNAFRKNDDIPPIEQFIDRLEAKLKSDIKIGLRLEVTRTYPAIDAPKPSATGRVREDYDEYGSKGKQQKMFD
jgi:hypothetical protein